MLRDRLLILRRATRLEAASPEHRYLATLVVARARRVFRAVTAAEVVAGDDLGSPKAMTALEGGAERWWCEPRSSSAGARRLIAGAPHARSVRPSESCVIQNKVRTGVRKMAPVSMVGFRSTSLLMFLACLLTTPTTTAETADQEAPSIEDRITALEEASDLMILRYRDLSTDQPKKSAPLRCGEAGFSVITTTTSRLEFLVRCHDVEKFLEGHKLIIDIGNPYYIDFSDVGLTIRYSDNLEERFKESHPSLSEPMKAGTWSRYSVILNPSTPEELREVELEIEVGGAHLITTSPQ